ncbi:MAG: S8 family peptidase [Armatimonadota bacterium]
MRSHPVLRGFAVLALLATLSVSASRDATASLLSNTLGGLLPGGSGGSARVIVQTSGTPSSLLLRLVGLLGGTIHAQFEVIDGFAATLPLSSLSTLLARADVLHISPDLPVRGAADYTAEAVGATAVRQATGLSGAGVGIAVLDTGVAPHPDLVQPVNRLTGWVDLVNGRSTPYDDNGHGTHVAGIAAGDGGAAAAAGRDLRGIAPGANIIGVKVLHGDLSGYASTVIKGLDFCVRERNRLNIRVANLSLGQPVRESYKKDPLCRAVEKVWHSGIVVVVSAGNRGRIDPQDPDSGVRYGSITAPGNDPLAITVGATRSNFTLDPSDDEMATYSSRGPTQVDQVLKPDLVAPGNRILSLGCAAATDGVTLGGARYRELSGTSMAAPAVAGAVALMLQAQPDLDPDTVKVRLMHSATKYWNAAVPYQPYARGAGRLSIPAALDEPEYAVGQAVSPTVQREEQAGQHSVRGGGSLWGNREQWRGRRLWSDGAIWAYGAMPQDAPPSNDAHILWGEPTLWGDQALWSDAPPASENEAHILWGEPTRWPD